MHINKIGFNHFHDTDFFINRPEGSGDYLMLLVKTPAVFVTGGEQITTASASVMLYRIGTPQLYGASDTQFGNDWFHFLPDNDDDERLLSELSIPFDTPTAVGSLSELSVLINLMCSEWFSSNPQRTQSLDLLLRLFFLKLSEKLTLRAEGGFGDRYERMTGIRTMIYNLPAREWTIDTLASRLHMSRSSFQHTYKRVFGVTPMSDVIAARTEHAKYLLSSTDHTVAHIAQLCGYASDIHFMRQFRRQTGMTPTAYRRTGRI